MSLDAPASFQAGTATLSPGRLATPRAVTPERFERLLEAGIAISSEHALDAVLQRIVDAARSVVGARYAALGVIGPDGRSLSRFETSGLDAEVRERIGALPQGHGLLGMIIREARAIRIPRISEAPQRHGFPPHHPPMESFLGVPIRGRTRIYGNLYLTEKDGATAFTEEDERIAVLLAAQAATAIESAQLMQDQTELLESLKSLQRQRDQFFAMINHELRNALTGVYGWAEQLHRARSEAAAERAGKEVFEAAERTITLLNNLLDLSRLDAGKVQPVFRRCRLDEVMARAANQVRPAAEKKGVTVRTEIVPGPVEIDTDAIRLEQILVNLLSNAVRHSPADEDVVMRGECLGDETYLHVSDRGNGIALQDQPRIFEAFIRVDPESGIGSGLGLPVSRRMAEMLGGRLTVSSDLGRGATFTLVLPGSCPT